VKAPVERAGAEEPLAAEHALLVERGGPSTEAQPVLQALRRRLQGKKGEGEREVGRENAGDARRIYFCARRIHLL
jgi:hypothetical protein